MSFVELDTAIRTPTPSLNMIFKVNVGVLNVPAKNWPELVTIDIWKMFERHNKAHHSSLFFSFCCLFQSSVSNAKISHSSQ